ncbi:MAG: hypothetical protein RSE32_15395 [Comamonas sp.]|uniref:hypothetical protein n=1 Tax=Comamonas sp. TaxID=34028 RepID=UPI002FC5C3AB
MSNTPKTEASKPAAPAKNRIVVWMIALPVVIFGALMLVGQFMDDPESTQRWTDNETIKICWKQTAKPEAERKTNEFKSPQDCERLEFDFKTRYGANP